MSVIVTTWNRSQMLKEMLASFFQAHPNPKFEFEVIVVDNNSTDSTKKVVQEALKQYGDKLKYVFERKQGISSARNAGLKVASGKLVAFLDDDIFMADGWMDSLIKGFEDHPEAACLGGKIETLFEGPKPAWLTEKHLKHFKFGATNFEETEHRLVYPKYPPGSNMAFRSDVFKSIKAFNPHLGRNKSKLLSCEETELFFRIQQAGLICYYIPQAKIIHRIEQNKLRKRWIFSRFYWQGVSEVILIAENTSPEPGQIFRSAMTALSAFLKEATSLSFENLVAACLQAGRFVQGSKQLFQCLKNRIWQTTTTQH